MRVSGFSRRILFIIGLGVALPALVLAVLGVFLTLRISGMMLRDANGEIIGCGGWWIDPRDFLERHVGVVMEERLTANTRMYGGIESIRSLSVDLLAPGGAVIQRTREPGSVQTAGT